MAAAISRWWSLTELWNLCPSRERERRVWSTAKTGSAAIESSVLQLASITVEWKSALWTNCSCVPRRSGWPGIAARRRSRCSSLRRSAASLAAGTSSSARTSSSSSSVTSADDVIRPRPERSDSETCSALGVVTYEPPPTPFAVRMRLCAARRRSASRTVARLTPKSSASWSSLGRRSPRASSSVTMSCRSRSATCSYAFGTTRCRTRGYRRRRRVGSSGSGRAPRSTR